MMLPVRPVLDAPYHSGRPEGRLGYLPPDTIRGPLGSSSLAEQGGYNRMQRLQIIVLISLAFLMTWTLPYAIQAIEVLQARDDPARIVELKLSRQFNAVVAEENIETALEAGKPGLAHSFIELARQRGLAIDPALVEKVQKAVDAEASFSATAWRFAHGFVTGDPQDAASLAGTAVSDLLVFGDIRDAAREG